MFFEYFRENRRLKTDEQKKLVNKLLGLRCPIPRICEEILRELGIRMIPKDLQNMIQSGKESDEDSAEAARILLRDVYRKSFINIIIQVRKNTYRLASLYLRLVYIIIRQYNRKIFWYIMGNYEHSALMVH